jgi:hypothetical protein
MMGMMRMVGMMRMMRTTLNGAYAILLVTCGVLAYGVLSSEGQSGTDAAMLGTVRLTHPVLADGKPLAAGTYSVRLTSDQPPAATGETPGAERWVEFVKNDQVAGREIATVISAVDIGAVAEGPQPNANASRVDVLKGGDYLRVWINKAGNHYLINMPLVVR